MTEEDWKVDADTASRTRLQSIVTIVGTVRRLYRRGLEITASRIFFFDGLDDGDDEIHGYSKGLPDGFCVQCGDMRVHALNLKDDRAGSVAWARSLLNSGGFCVLDSETTGLTPPVQFVEVAIVEAGAKTLFEGTLRPDCRIEPGATRIHGHTASSLADSPPFWEVYPDLLEALWGSRVVVYNAPYDRRVWDGEVRSLGARGSLAGEPPPWECVMRRYVAYVGEPSKRGGYRSQKLPGGDHSALGDALATLRLIEEMATGRG